MQQAPTLSAEDRTVLEASLSRMVGDAFGALATLPLYCLGDLPASDPQAIVADHYDIWHSCLVVARETVRSEAGALDWMPQSLESLLATASELRDAYLAIHAGATADAVAARDAFRRLSAAYERLPLLLKELSCELGLDDSFLPPSGGLKHVSYQRTLAWLGEELRERAGQT